MCTSCLQCGNNVKKCARHKRLKLQLANKACVLNRAVQDCGRRLNQSLFRPMAEVSFLPSVNTRKRASANREKVNMFVKKNNHCVQQNAVLMQTAVRFYGVRDEGILGCKIGLPAECGRGENELQHRKARIDFSIIHSFVVMILCCTNQCLRSLFHQDAR